MKERTDHSRHTEADPDRPFLLDVPVTSILAHPDDLASDPGLSTAEKRTILASWVSDARAVENAPELRQLDSGTMVHVDDLLRALRGLDENRCAEKPKHSEKWPAPIARRRAVLFSRWLRRGFGPGRDDDDDDPPPCPAGVGRPFRPSLLGGAAAEPQAA